MPITHQAHIGLAAALAAASLGLWPALASAWVLNVTPGARAVYLAVGDANANATINRVTATLPAAAVATGGAQAMISSSTQANSPFDNFTACTPASGQVYIGGFFRRPTTNVTSAVLQVTTPTNLTSGTDVIAFDKISWTSTALGNAAADIPAGTFVSGGTRFLRNIRSNTYVENCHTFSYANTAPVAAGTYSGRATYTLTTP